MGTLIFVCPATGLEVFTGLEMDTGAELRGPSRIDTFATLPSVLPDIRCPHCPKPHELSEVNAWLADGEERINGTNIRAASGDTAAP